MASSAKISVWWDMASCGLPPGVQPHEVAGSIRSSLANRGFKGPLIINAYGDSKRISPIIIDSITATGMAFHHVPGGKRHFVPLLPRDPPDSPERLSVSIIFF